MSGNLEETIKACLDLSTDLWNKHHQIEVSALHPCDLTELTRDIHNIQNRLYTIASLNGILIGRDY